MKGVSAWINPSAIVLCILAAAHAGVAWENRTRRPELEIITAPPSEAARAAMSFGDQQFLYRLWTMDLQNAGDTGGRMTPMRYYNYSNVIGWLDALGELDPRGEHHLYLAVRYFSQTPETDDVRRLMEFVERDVARSPATKWFWLTQALVIAEKRLRDLPYALQISERLATLNPADAPNWVFMMPAILMEKMGRLPAAESAIRQVRAQRGQGMRTDELLFIDSFIQRLHGSPG